MTYVTSVTVSSDLCLLLPLPLSSVTLYDVTSVSCDVCLCLV